MLKAATLYIVLIISLMIAVISVSLLSVAFYYRLEHQKKARLDRLTINLESGTAILLSAGYLSQDSVIAKDLYGDQQDSVLLYQTHWGVFGLNTVRTFEQGDTLKRAFLHGPAYMDSSAIYLADEDRPLSLSGNTQITGNGELPKSGLKQSYVDGKAYAGKELIKGKIMISTRDVPPLEEKWIAEILKPFDVQNGESFNARDSVLNSFFNPVGCYQLKPSQDQFSGLKLKGKIILISDTTLTLEQDVILEDVLIYAKSIIVKDGFKGACQLFARDSIVIGKRCNFLYPSFAGVFKTGDSKIQSKISLGQDTRFSGILLSYEKKRSDLQTMISIGKDCLVNGEVFATGYIKLEAPLTVKGKVSAKRFIMQRSATLYENYLIDVVLNRNLLSKYYLSSPLFQRENQDNQILKWLN
jgi:hypothetical protein